MYVQTSGSMLAILLALIAAGGSVVGTEGKRVAPLIDDDWTKRPHRAAGKLFPRTHFANLLLSSQLFRILIHI